MIGCGKMGGALLEQWRIGRDQFTICDPALDAAPEGVELVKGPGELEGRAFDVAVVAVKPQMIEQVMGDYIPLLTPSAYLLSIAAGFSIGRLEALSGGRPVIRVMPNLPAAIGRGVSGICASAEVDRAALAHATALMGLAGTVIEVPDEDALDRFTAVAGSGPGYVFELARAYVEAAKGLGFSHDEARRMVIATLEGTLAMASSSDEPLESLRNSVTSKGGTTAAGLAALNGEGELDRLLASTLTSAYERAVELR
ncbi:MAG: pyrroline-5-carboxylate reductase [Erythrobacter sp.]|jgi:pyrroline-5-carboxylate reductase|nr:pyrroline-5-carboxylate reductase [Erythrobacter sp.]